MAFLDNLAPTLTGKGVTALSAQIGAKPLLRPEAYEGLAVGLAGDELDVKEATGLF